MSTFYNVTTMGLPFHGLVYDGDFTKPDDSVVPVTNASPVNYLLDMGHEKPDRTGNQLDIDNGYEWRDKLLLSGFTSLPLNQFVYVDGDSIPWIIQGDYEKVVGFNQYSLKVQVVRRFGLFEKEAAADLNHEFFDSGILDYEALESTLGLNIINGLTYNQNSNGSSVAVTLRATFNTTGSVPVLSWAKRFVVEVRILGISGTVNQLTGAGLVGSYDVQVSSVDCCGGYINEQTPPVYTSFGHGRHEIEVSSPNPPVQTTMCDYFDAPWSGNTYTYQNDWDDYQVQKAPSGAREPLIVSASENKDVQNAVVRAYYDADALKVAKIRYSDYVFKPVDGNREPVALNYTYDYAYRADGDYLMTRDNNCLYYTWSFVSSFTKTQTLNYQFRDKRGYAVDILVDDTVMDSITADRTRLYTSTMNTNTSGPLQNDGGTDELLTGVTMIPSSDVDDPDYPAGLNSIPTPVGSGDTLTLTVSGVVFSLPGSSFFNSFEYPSIHLNDTTMGNVLVGFDTIPLDGWEIDPPNRYYGLVGPTIGSSIKGAVGSYAVYDPFNLLTHNDYTRQLCVI